jgi:hypothetical protein
LRHGTKKGRSVIARFILRGLVVVLAFGIAVGVALVVLLALGAMWVGDELRTGAPHDPLFRHGGATAFGVVLFTGFVAPTLTALPAFVAVVVGEVLRLRSWLYYVLAGGASLAAVPLLAGLQANGAPDIPASEYMTIFATAGFAGGFIYWLLAGARA